MPYFVAILNESVNSVDIRALGPNTKPTNSRVGQATKQQRYPYLSSAAIGQSNIFVFELLIGIIKARRRHYILGYYYGN